MTSTVLEDSGGGGHSGVLIMSPIAGSTDSIFLLLPPVMGTFTVLDTKGGGGHSGVLARQLTSWSAVLTSPWRPRIAPIKLHLKSRILPRTVAAPACACASLNLHLRGSHPHHLEHSAPADLQLQFL